LFLEREHAPVPELCLVEQRIQNRRRIALARAPLNTNRDRSAVSEGPGRIMTGSAGNRVIGRQALIEKQTLAKTDFPRRNRIVRRYCRPHELLGHSNLPGGHWTRQPHGKHYNPCPHLY
jgi:hypothetical protein